MNDVVSVKQVVQFVYIRFCCHSNHTNYIYSLKPLLDGAAAPVITVQERGTLKKIMNFYTQKF